MADPVGKISAALERRRQEQELARASSINFLTGMGLVGNKKVALPPLTGQLQAIDTNKPIKKKKTTKSKKLPPSAPQVDEENVAEQAAVSPETSPLETESPPPEEDEQGDEHSSEEEFVEDEDEVQDESHPTTPNSGIVDLAFLKQFSAAVQKHKAIMVDTRNQTANGGPKEAPVRKEKAGGKTQRRQLPTKKTKVNKRKADDSDDEEYSPPDTSEIIDKKDAEIARLKALVATSGAIPGGKMTKKQLSQVLNSGNSTLVKGQIQYLWRTCKFIRDEKHLEEKTEVILEDLIAQGHFTECSFDGVKPSDYPMVKANRVKWIAVHKEIVNMELNGKRSYTQVRARDACFAYMDGKWHGDNKQRELPSVELMEKIIKRDMNVTPEELSWTDADFDEDGNIKQEVLDSKLEEAVKERMELFLWYSTQLLPCFALSKFYGEDHFHKGPISTLTIPNTDNQKAVHVSTEAMAYVAFDNCHTRWVNLQKWRLANPNYDKSKGLPKYCKVQDPTSEIYKGKYSDGAQGQTRFGGWSMAGINVFRNMITAVKVNRRKKLDKLVEIEDIVVQFAKKKRGTKRAAGKDGAAAAKKQKEDDSNEEEALVELSDEEGED